jgi:hypothetical protein
MGQAKTTPHIRVRQQVPLSPISRDFETTRNPEIFTHFEFSFFSSTMDSSLYSKEIVCWDLVIFVIWVVSG